jgi:hypothetical protein
LQCFPDWRSPNSQTARQNEFGQDSAWRQLERNDHLFDLSVGPVCEGHVTMHTFRRSALRRSNEEEDDAAFFDGLSVRFEALDLLFSAMNVSELSVI